MTPSKSKLGWLWSPQPRERWVLVMLVVTAIYLLVECAFSARLLDVVGGMPDEGSVQRIEHRGRLISGMAAALFFWPMLLKHGTARAWGLLRIALVLAVVSTVAVCLTYWGELKLVDHQVERSSAEQRYLAVNVVTVQNALVVGGVQLDALDLSKDMLAQPDGKTFLAVFPMLAYTTRDLVDKIRDQKATMLRVVSDQKYGGKEVNYNRYLASRKELIQRYNSDYRNGCDEYNRALDGIGGEQARAWSTYTRKLARRGLTPDRVPPPYWSKVRNEVRALGVPVTPRWDPADRGAFNAAIERKVREQAAQRFRSATADQFNGASVPPNLDAHAFFAFPAVQQAWREKLGYSASQVTLPLELPAEKQALSYFDRSVYQRVLDWQVKELLTQHDAPVDQFADNAPYAKLGLEGMRALVVPPIALGFSIMGAMLHVVKLALFALQLGFGRGFSSGLVKFPAVLLLALGLLGSFSFAPTSAIPRQPLYQYFEERGATLFGDGEPNWKGKAALFFTRSVIQAQPITYPVFEAVRVHLLFDYDFGYRPTTPADRHDA